MGWEKRGNNLYYYQKIRDGGRVVSVYVGRGKQAEMITSLDALSRQQRALSRKKCRLERDRIDAVDRMVRDVEDVILTLTRAALLASGCHTHHGTWRRRRNGRD